MTPEEIASLRKKFDDFLDDARKRHVPTIVLWGPGSRYPARYEKRLKLIEHIRQESPNATVILPEDPQVQRFMQEYTRDPDDQELMQARVVDLVFALDTSPEVGEEIARYSRTESVLKKLIVISPHSKRSGYSGIIRKKLKVEFFSEEELQHCDRASNYCREQVRAWLIRKAAEDDS